MLSDGVNDSVTSAIASISNDILDPPNTKLLKRLGSGSFGVVYGYPRQNIKVAIKQIATNKSELSEVQNEIDAHRDLNHDNIVRYHGSRQCGDSVFLFLEYIDGGSLLEYLQKHETEDHRSGLSVEQILTYSAQILDGLAYLHSKRIVHRDLRAANILRKRTDILKITDFGISVKWDNALTRGKSVFHTQIGNEFWMAPELNCLDKAVVGNRSVDVWSFGIVLLELACVTPPFIKDMTRVRFCIKLCVEKVLPCIPEYVDSKIKLLVEKCLVFKPEERMSVGDLLELTLDIKGDKELIELKSDLEPNENIQPDPPRTTESRRGSSCILISISGAGDEKEPSNSDNPSDQQSAHQFRICRDRLISVKDSIEDIFQLNSTTMKNSEMDDVVGNRLWRVLTLDDIPALRDKPDLPEYHYTEFIIKCLQAHTGESGSEPMVKLFDSINQAELSHNYVTDLHDLFWKFTVESVIGLPHNPYIIDNTHNHYRYSSEEWNLSQNLSEQLCQGHVVNLVTEWCRVPGCTAHKHGISVRLLEEMGYAKIVLENPTDEKIVKLQHVHEHKRYVHFYFNNRKLDRTLNDHCSVWFNTYSSIVNFIRTKSWHGLSLSVLIANDMQDD